MQRQAKKAYESPTLTIFGTVQELTLGDENWDFKCGSVFVMYPEKERPWCKERGDWRDDYKDQFPGTTL